MLNLFRHHRYFVALYLSTGLLVHTESIVLILRIKYLPPSPPLANVLQPSLTPIVVDFLSVFHNLMVAFVVS